MKLMSPLLLFAFATIAAAPPDPLIEAERRIKRLPPSAYRQLPSAVSAYLQRRGCRIPQTALSRSPHNVIHGPFFGPARKDWAVVCSQRGESSILVFRQGTSAPAKEFGPTQDRHYVERQPDGSAVYSIKISPVDRRTIWSYQRAFGGVLPPSIDHQGIDEYFDGKASIIHYYYKGRWLELQGMD